MASIDQKEYLKKYLGIGKRSGEKKKKKKTKKIVSNGLKIVDDDIDVKLNEEIQVDLTADNEEAPQIVSVIDDRPPSLRIDEVTKEKLWVPLGSSDNPSNADNDFKFEGSIKLSKNNSMKGHSSKIRKTKLDTSPRRTNIDYDFPPSRKYKTEKSEDNSPKRINRQNSDCSPPRRIKRESSEDNSPKRKRTNSDSSPPRRNKEKHDEGDTKDLEDKMKKTLSGKKSGLQNAKDLVVETHELKQKEDELFKNMSAEVSGANAATVVRGKKKDINWEEEEQRRKKQEENKEKYDKWGRGLKQVDDVNEKIKNDLYEMSKPLARYADDEDLEKYLKEQERDGDPMLAYLRKKKRKKAVEEGKPVMQQYEGDAPPNRFGIRPGYRWDGVDRSTGYEKQWFQVQNSREASREESYKWSTEDM